MDISNKFSSNLKYYAFNCEGFVEVAGACLGGIVAVNLCNSEEGFKGSLFAFISIPIILVSSLGSIIVTSITLATIHTGVELTYETYEFITNVLGVSDSNISPAKASPTPAIESELLGDVTALY